MYNVYSKLFFMGLENKIKAFVMLPSIRLEYSAIEIARCNNNID